MNDVKYKIKVNHLKSNETWESAWNRDTKPGFERYVERLRDKAYPIEFKNLKGDWIIIPPNIKKDCVIEVIKIEDDESNN